MDGTEETFEEWLLDRLGRYNTKQLDGFLPEQLNAEFQRGKLIIVRGVMMPNGERYPAVTVKS